MIEYRRRDYETLRSVAQKFLDEHHPSGVLPVPIEEIVEFRLKLDIVPILGLREASKAGATGFLTCGLDAIYVDQYIQQEREARYRFTLAYEVGRYVLQRELIAGCAVDSIASFVKWHQSVPDDVWNRAKFECYDFAGLLLVPTQQLNREARRVHDRNVARARAAGQDPLEHQGILWSSIASQLATEVFHVSDDVTKKRLKLERLLPPGVTL